MLGTHLKYRHASGRRCNASVQAGGRGQCRAEAAVGQPLLLLPHCSGPCCPCSRLLCLSRLAWVVPAGELALQLRGAGVMGRRRLRSLAQPGLRAAGKP